LLSLVVIIVPTVLAVLKRARQFCLSRQIVKKSSKKPTMGGMNWDVEEWGETLLGLIMICFFGIMGLGLVMVLVPSLKPILGHPITWLYWLFLVLGGLFVLGIFGTFAYIIGAVLLAVIKSMYRRMIVFLYSRLNTP
jgi:hypothetical protein